MKQNETPSAWLRTIIRTGATRQPEHSSEAFVRPRFCEQRIYDLIKPVQQWEHAEGNPIKAHLSGCLVCRSVFCLNSNISLKRYTLRKARIQNHSDPEDDIKDLGRMPEKKIN